MTFKYWIIKLLHQFQIILIESQSILLNVCKPNNLNCYRQYYFVRCFFHYLIFIANNKFYTYVYILLIN
jgi:hypothetical protein